MSTLTGWHHEDVDELFIATLDKQGTPDATIVDPVRERRTRHVRRLLKQGWRRFRAYDAKRGQKVEIVALDHKKSKAMVEGARGIWSVALADLYPMA